jgi:hypothetical protein
LQNSPHVERNAEKSNGQGYSQQAELAQPGRSLIKQNGRCDKDRTSFYFHFKWWLAYTSTSMESTSGPTTVFPPEETSIS